MQKRLGTALRSYKKKRWDAVLSDGKGTGSKDQVCRTWVPRVPAVPGSDESHPARPPTNKKIIQTISILPT